MQTALSTSHVLPPSSVKRPLVVFRIGAQLFALEAPHVRAAMRMLDVTPVPTAPAGIVGIAWYEDKPVSVVDLRHWFDMPARHASVTPAVLMVMQENELVALLVDKIEDVLRVTSNDFAAAPVTMEPAWRQVTSSVVEHQGGLIAVLNVAGILRAVVQ
jgi:chemotaxis signal transduction protein